MLTFISDGNYKLQWMWMPSWRSSSRTCWRSRRRRTRRPWRRRWRYFSRTRSPRRWRSSEVNVATVFVFTFISLEKTNKGYDVNVRVTKTLPPSACYLDAILWNADAGCCKLYHKPGKKTEKCGEERFEEKGLRQRSEVPINPIHPTLYHWSSLSSNFCSVLYNMLSFIMSNNGHVKYLKETMLQPSRRWNHSKF